MLSHVNSDHPMTTQVDKLLEEAMRLPEADRIRLAERILATSDRDADADAAEEWAREIERRSREIDQGLVQPIPWSEVRDAAARKNRGHR